MTTEAIRRRRPRSFWLAGLWLLLSVASPATAQKENPLESVDTSSPRATLTSFLEEMNQAVTLYREEDDREGARELILDAVRCLDLSEVPPTVVETVGFETALRLKEVLDRISVPSPRSIPDAAQMEESLTGSWSIPDTPLVIAQVAEGPRAGEYLFSPETVARSEEFYERVRELPYRPRTGKGAHYEEYQLGDGEFLSRRVASLPDWTKQTYKGQAVWQWAGMALCLAIGSALTALLYVAGRRLSASREHLGAYVLPVTLMAVSVLFEFVFREIHLTGGVFTALTLLVTGLFFLGGVRLVAVVLNQIADLVISTAHLRPRGVDGQLVRLAFRIVIIAVTAALLIAAADQLGLPAYSLLTGLGIGGLAVALAARETLANFLGSVVIMLERPFRVGDWVKVAGQEGNVEDIGFRSTRIRTFYNSLVTIPSSEIVGTSIDNMGMRRYRRVRTVVQVTYDTPSEKIEAFIEGIKEIIRTHPTTRKDYFHVVFHDFGAHSLDILVYFFIVAPDWSVELVERQKLLLEVVRLAEHLGVNFAFPTQTVHVESLPEEKGLVPEEDEPPAPPA
jgi:MscS family membrane protein